MSVVTKKLSAEEKEELLKDILGRDYTTAGNNLPVLRNLIDKIGYVDTAFTVAELVPLLNTILAIRIFSIVASGASIISVFLFPIAALISIINAYEAGRRMYSYRAVAYALTSWAFNKPVLNSSQRILLQIRTGFPMVPVQEITEYEEVWKKTSQDVLNKINAIPIENNIPKESLQVFFRLISDNNAQKLCDMLMKGFEKEFSFIEIKVWESNYSVRYPG